MTGKFKTEISREWIAHALREFGADIPEDASLVGMEYHAERDIYECVFESSETPDVVEGGKVLEIHELETVENLR